MATASRSNRPMATARPAPTSPASPPNMACCSATALRSSPERREPGTVRVIVSRSIAHVPGCPVRRRASGPERDLDQLRLRDQFEPRGDDRRSATTWSSARPAAPPATRRPPPRRSRSIATPSRPEPAACRAASSQESTDERAHEPPSRRPARSLLRLRRRRGDRRDPAADRRRAWLGARKGQQGRPPQRRADPVGLGEPGDPVRRPFRIRPIR